MALVPFGSNRKGAERHKPRRNPMPESMSNAAQQTNPRASGTNTGQGMPVSPGTDATTTKNTQTKHRTPQRVSGRPYEQR